MKTTYITKAIELTLSNGDVIKDTFRAAAGKDNREALYSTWSGKWIELDGDKMAKVEEVRFA